MRISPEQNFIVSLDLKYLKVPSTATPVEHFVYATSVYATTFAVFCSITDYTEDGKSIIISGLNLKIVNYVGAFNVGFLKDGDAEFKEVDGKPNVFFNVQGESLRETVPCKITKPVTVTNGAPVVLAFNRMLYPLEGFVKLNQPGAPRDPIIDGVPKTRLFDTEYNARNGVDLYFNELRPGMIGATGVKSSKPTILIPSLRCHQSFVRLVYG